MPPNVLCCTYTWWWYQFFTLVPYRNSYYGDTWANLMYRDVATWVEGTMEPIRIEKARDLELKEGEKVVDLKLLEVSSGTTNVVCSVCE